MSDSPKLRLSQIKAFRAQIWGFYRASGRHDLPWRKTKDPYKILVSEVMLQQTQVGRVVEKYAEFLKAFPAVEVLANASLAEVLRVWQGMGYNRRARYLRGKIIRALAEKPMTFTMLKRICGNEPRTKEALDALIKDKLIKYEKRKYQLA